MRHHRARRWAAAAVAAQILAYLAWRPRMLRWGATQQEATEPLPGDDLEPSPTTQSTRAITIDAPPERVWPWLVQMGSDRAGFYTHEWVERPLGIHYVDGHSATRIHPELQDLKVGDRFAYGGGAEVEVYEMEPFSHLVHAEAFVLRPLPGGRTRLIVRYRGQGYLRPAVQALSPDAPAPARLAEGQIRPHGRSRPWFQPNRGPDPSTWTVGARCGDDEAALTTVGESRFESGGGGGI